MAVLFMQSRHAAIIPAAVTATRHSSRMADFSFSLSFSLRIPFFYHLASPLPVEASCIGHHFRAGSDGSIRLCFPLLLPCHGRSAEYFICRL